MTHEWKGPAGQDVCRRCGLKRGAADMFGIPDCTTVRPPREETLHAEIDHLHAQLAAARQCADDWKVCAERERDAALEEAIAAIVTASIPLPLDLWQGTKKALTEALALRLAERVRALKSKP